MWGGSTEALARWNGERRNESIGRGSDYLYVPYKVGDETKGRRVTLVGMEMTAHTGSLSDSDDEDSFEEINLGNDPVFRL